MKRLIAKLGVVDGFGNTKNLMVFTDAEEGTVSYELRSKTDVLYSVSNLQCGWRGHPLPDNIYEYDDNEMLLNVIESSVKGGVYSVTNKKLFIK